MATFTHETFDENGWRFRVVQDNATVIETSDVYELKEDAEFVGKAAAEKHAYREWKRTAVDPMATK